jgi:hypothetical protein
MVMLRAGIEPAHPGAVEPRTSTPSRIRGNRARLPFRHLNVSEQGIIRVLSVLLGTGVGDLFRIVFFAAVRTLAHRGRV